MRVIQIAPLRMVDHHRRKYLIILHLHGRMPDILRILRFPVDFTHQTSLLLLCCWLFGNRVYDLWFMVFGFSSI